MAEQTVNHPNLFGLVIRSVDGKGRGIFATRSIPVGTVVDISPVIVFSKEEYANFARHTIINDYAFTWSSGQMALALGLGSLFNHSSQYPNTSYSKDVLGGFIRFTTMRHIEPGDELCIYYGPNLWFEDVSSSATTLLNSSQEALAPQESQYHNNFSLFDPQDVAHHSIQEGVAISAVAAVGDSTTGETSGFQGNQRSLSVINTGAILANDFPLERFHFPDEQRTETDSDAIKTIQVWATDVKDLAKIGLLLEKIRTCTQPSEAEALRHLKRVRRSKNQELTVPVCNIILAPAWPDDTGKKTLSSRFITVLEAALVPVVPPYIIEVPATPALTPSQLVRKSAMWPVSYLPSLDKASNEKQWTMTEIEWVRKGFKRVVSEAKRAWEIGEVSAHCGICISKLRIFVSKRTG